MKPLPPEPGPDVASWRSGIHPCSATGDQCDTGHLSQCQLWGSGVGTQSKEASGASHKGKSPLCRQQEQGADVLAVTRQVPQPWHPCAGCPWPSKPQLSEIPARPLSSSSSFHSPLPLWLLPRAEILHNLLMDLAQGRFFKGADGRWHLIPFGCGYTELPLDRRKHKHPPASPQSGLALISWHFLMNPQCCSLQGWAAVSKNLSAFPKGRSQTKGFSSPTQILPWPHPKSYKSTKCGILCVFLLAASLNHRPR